jgi:hypothetical protein
LKPGLNKVESPIPNKNSLTPFGVSEKSPQKITANLSGNVAVIEPFKLNPITPGFKFQKISKESSNS